MLETIDSVTNLPVKDIQKARPFYEDTLGLKLVDEEGGMVLTYQSGKAKIFVYQSDYAGTNKATAATWVVGDKFDALIKDLKAKRVNFEHYDMPGLKQDGDVYSGNGMKVAWFKDPDGNILCVVNG